MKPEQLLDAMSELDDDLLLESEQEDRKDKKTSSGKSKVTYLRRWAPLAACACVVLVIFAAVPKVLQLENNSLGTKQSTTVENDAETYDLASASEQEGEEYNDEERASDSTEEANAEEDASWSVGEEAAVSEYVIVNGNVFYELDEQSAADIGIDLADLKDPEELTEEDLGEAEGEITESSDSSLAGCMLYQTENEYVYIAETEDGYRYFCR